MVYGIIGENIMKMTELKQFPEGLNLSFYLMVPLIFDKYEDWWSLLKEDCHSIHNGYIYDKNTPSLEHIFKIAIDTEMSSKMEVERFSANENYKSKYTGRFSNKEDEPIFLDLYSFSINEKCMDVYEKIKLNKYFEIDTEIKKRILSFWNSTVNSNLYNSLFVTAIEPIRTCDDVLQEKDKQFDLATEFIVEMEKGLADSLKGIKLA